MAQDSQYGGFWVRLVALILDNAIVFAILLALGILLAVAGIEVPEIAAYAIAAAVPMLYWAALESSSRQATFGKRIMGLQVADADGNRLSFLRAALRQVAKIISAIPLGIGFLVAAFHPRKQALHDLIVKSVVPRVGPSQLWKVAVALIVGLLLMVASAAGLFYFVVVPMFKKGMDDSMKGLMKAPAATTSAPQPARKAPPPQASPAAPAPKVAAQAAAPGKQGPDPEFDAIAGKPIVGLEKPNTTRAGPAILELSTVFPGTVWVKVYMPVPSLGDPALMPNPAVTVNRVLDASGNNHYDPGNTFEQGRVFTRPKLSPTKEPVPHLAGIRSVHFMKGLSEQALQRIDGQLSIQVPVDPKVVVFEAAETGKEKPVHDSVVALRSVDGGTAKLHFRGASDNMLEVRGIGADGKPLALESRQILPENRDVAQDFIIMFKGVPSRIEVAVAARIIERTFPFSLVRGAVAGPPASVAEGYTVPPRQRAAPQVASAPAPSVAIASKPAPAPARPEPKPPAMAVPKAVPAPASADRVVMRRSRAHEDARECLALPTNDAIIRCAEKFR